MADGGYPNKIKRPCLEDVTLSMGPGAHPTLSTELQMPTLTMNPSSADLGVAGQSLLLENNPLDNNAVNSSAMGSPFGVPSTADTGLKGHAIPYYEKNNNMPAVDQELQDLLEELTKIQEPSSNDLDLEKILGNKPEEPVVEHHSQAPLGPPAKLPIQMPLMESLGPSKEYASSCSQATDTSLPVLPSSTEINYPIPPTSKQITSPSSSTAQAQVKNQAQTMLPVTLPPLSVPQWHHANQLKALAASKQGSATKHHGSNRSWSNLPTPGLSPPYLRVPSPHPPPTQPPPPPPFSPQNFTAPCMSSNSLSGSAAQSSSNALLSSMAPSSNAALGPTLSYAPAKLPALPHNQKPQFSPQSSILANLVSSSVKSPQGHLLSAVPTSTPGPSPPYRPENLSSPGLPQQSFTPQYSLIKSLTPTSSLLSQQQQQQQQQQHQLQHQQQQQQQANSIFKPMTSSQQSKTLSMIMQQGLASSSPEGPEPFIFSNTKPLSHFVSEPSLQKMASMPASSRQSSLFYYLPQATPAHVPSATASSTATATLQLQQLQQQHHQQQHHQQQLHQQQLHQQQLHQQQLHQQQLHQQQLHQQQLHQQQLHQQQHHQQQHHQQQLHQQQQQHHHHQKQQQPDQSSFLLQQTMQQPQRFQRMVASDSMPALPGQQENQRSGPMAMTPKQRNIYIAQQMTQFQAVQEQVISKCIQTHVRPPSNQHMMPPKTELLQDNLIPRLLPPSSHIGVCSSALKKQQVNTGFPFPISSGLGQDPLNSLGSVCPKAKAMPPEVPLPKFCVNHLGSQSFTSHQLSFPSVPMMSLVFSNAVWAVAAAAVATPVSKKSPLSQVDICMLQCCDSSTILFAKAPISVPPTALAFPSQRAVVQANQIAPGVRPGQKVPAALVGPRFSLLGNQSFVQSPAQGPVPVLSTTPLQQSMASCSPLSPVQGLEPPSYVAAIAATSQSPGTLMRASTSPEPQDNVLPQAQSPTNGLISPSSAGSEVNFVEELLEGSSVAPDEDWVCNLRLIDDILQQRAAAPNATAQNAEQVTQGAEEL